ncbi:MAG: hypothetical protein FMNOHCHN_02965 [Ignavibacteriaceae bacterium]|nr:hypothetical protein [Ignavibacteriaceae bacterium]
MKKMRLFVIAYLFLFSASLIAQSNSPVREGELDKKWSKISKSDIPQTVPGDANYIYIPTFYGPRFYDFGKSAGTVSANYRPFPMSNTTQSEVSVDVHPTNENIVFVSPNTTNWPVTTLYGTGGYFTSNGGTNWTGFDQPPYGATSGDPAVSIGTNGLIYTGFIDAGTNDGGQGVAVTSNNGTSWSRYVVGPRPPGASDLLDKNHLVVDKKAGSPYENRVYAAWTAFVSTSPNNNDIEVRYSSNNGQTWSNSSNVSGPINAGSHDQGINLSTGPNGEVYALWAVYDNWAAGVYGEDAIGFNKSTDGGATWAQPKRIYSAANFGIRGNLANKGNIRVSSFPVMGVDRTGGSRNGTIYAVWPQKTVAPAGSDPDIVLTKSSDGGETWAPLVRVNNDPLNNGKDQYYPWMTVDQSTGNVYVVFYDSRDVTNDSAHVYIARSTDGGTTFDNIKVTDRAFKPKTISGLASGYQGDYIGIAANRNTVYPTWADDRTGNYQIWMSTVTFGPSVTHDALTNTENLTGPYTVNVGISSSVPLDTNKLYVHWGRGANGAISDSVKLTMVGTDQYSANIPGNGSPAVYNYYIATADQQGGSTLLPAGAPGNYFSFTANIDSIAPVITHTALPNQFRETWPKQVNAVVTDNIGVDTVKVLHKKGFSGSVSEFMLAAGTDNSYSGVFNSDSSQYAVGDTVYYRIQAKDASSLGNYGYAPGANTWFTFAFVADQTAPVVTHLPLRDQPRLRWPARVDAGIYDTLGISAASVEYYRNLPANTGMFSLSPQGAGFTGVFDIDTTVVQVGDSIWYRIKAVDNSTNKNVSYYPSTGYFKFTVINTLGVVLVVNDDNTLAARVSSVKGGPGDLETPLGASSSFIAQTLVNAGYVVDTVEWAGLNAATLNNYDIVCLTAGTRTSAMFDDLAKRTEIVNYTLSGGKVIVEGGEVGYVYRISGTTTDKDPYFRRNVLNDSAWVSDVTTSTLFKKDPLHPIFNFPNPILDTLSFTNPSSSSWGTRDAMRIIPNKTGVFKLGTWSAMPDSASIIAYSPNNNPYNIRNVFLAFAIGRMNNLQQRTALVENVFNFVASGIIPVELTSFTASTINDQVTLSWVTASEKNNLGFEIERKSSKGSFEQVGFVQGNGTSLLQNSYVFTDRGLEEGNYSYRLKQIDFDGTYTYSDVVEVEILNPVQFALEQNYPNPFNPSTLIKFSLPVESRVELSVFNALGEKVRVLVNEVRKSGNHEVEFNALGLSSGVYFYKLEAGEFISTKKLILLK